MPNTASREKIQGANFAAEKKIIGVYFFAGSKGKTKKTVSVYTVLLHIKTGKSIHDHRTKKRRVLVFFMLWIAPKY